MSAPAHTDRIAGVALGLLGVAVALEAATFDALFLTDPVGPKALPMLAACILVGTGVTLVARPGSGGAWPGCGTLIRMAGAIAAFSAYAALLEPLGFVLSTTATVASLSMLFGGPWRKSVGAAAALAVVLWYLFVWLLGLPLPLGAAWETLWMR
jgi:putative tricarboxylic transport membrane protein